LDLILISDVVYMGKYKLERVEVEISAIREDALPRILVRLKLYGDLEKGNAKCYICDKKLTLGTIGAIAKINGKYVLICSNLSCIVEANILANRSRT